MCLVVAMLHRDRKSRALLVHLCSFGGSQDPIASATCFQSAPNSLDHGACTEAGPVILAVWCSSLLLQPGLSPCCLFGSQGPFVWQRMGAITSYYSCFHFRRCGEDVHGYSFHRGECLD
jgi:hypothetical protein